MAITRFEIGVVTLFAVALGSCCGTATKAPQSHETTTLLNYPDNAVPDVILAFTEQVAPWRHRVDVFVAVWRGGAIVWQEGVFAEYHQSDPRAVLPTQVGRIPTERAAELVSAIRSEVAINWDDDSWYWDASYRGSGFDLLVSTATDPNALRGGRWDQWEGYEYIRGRVAGRHFQRGAESEARNKLSMRVPTDDLAGDLALRRRVVSFNKIADMLLEAWGMAELVEVAPYPMAWTYSIRWADHFQSLSFPPLDERRR